jgi:hypothetical protein
MVLDVKFSTDNLPWARRERAALHAERDRANHGIDPFADFRRQLDSGAPVISPLLVGVISGDRAEYLRLMAQAFDRGYGIQRHPWEQLGEHGTAPMLVKRVGR